MKKIFFLFLVTTTYLVHAEFQVFAFKDRVWTWADEGYKNGHYVKVGEKLPVNSKLDLRTVDCYVALLNTETHKLIELEGNVYRSNEQLKELEAKAKELPSLELDLVKHERPVYRGCRCLGSEAVKIYPIDVKEYYAEDDKSVVLHYEVTPNDQRDYGKRIKLEAHDMLGNILYEKKLKPEASSGEVEIPIHKSPDTEMNTGIYIVKLTWGKEGVEKMIHTPKSEKYPASYQKKREQFVKYFDLNTMTVAEKIYAMIWTYQEDMTIEGYTVFRSVDDHDLSIYQGFEKYYLDLYKYYVKEEKQK